MRGRIGKIGSRVWGSEKEMRKVKEGEHHGYSHFHAPKLWRNARYLENKISCHSSRNDWCLPSVDYYSFPNPYKPNPWAKKHLNNTRSLLQQIIFQQYILPQTSNNSKIMLHKTHHKYGSESTSKSKILQHFVLTFLQFKIPAMFKRDPDGLHKISNYHLHFP